MKYHRIFLILAALTFSSLVNLGTTQPTSAVSAADWKPGNIISDSIFYDNGSMSVTDIQNFLNSKNPGCDTWGRNPASDWGRPDISRAQYAQSRGWPAPPYICLKDYHQVPRSDVVINNYNPSAIPPAGSLSAASIIKQAADTHGVNPKALIVLLQKESPGPLPIDQWPLENQYRNAMGYACPDTAPCDPQYAGFYNQMMNAARQIKIYRDNPNSFRHRAGTVADIYYNPNLNGCGSSRVFIESRATAGLYNYTPYQPNAAALNNMYGTGDGCSAYGNRNFWRIFSDWFGSTSSASSYTYQLQSAELYSNANYSTRLSSPVSAEPDTTVYARVTVKNTGNQVWNKDSLRLGTNNPSDRTSEFASSDWINDRRASSPEEATITPGGIATFKFTMRAPRELKQYSESFGVLIENQRWLDGNINLPITVATTSPYYSISSQSFDFYTDSQRTARINPNDISMYTGSKIFVRAMVKNTGNQTLPAGTTKIATSNPVDRSSIFKDSSWISENRTVGSKGGAIEPGKIGIFEFSMTAPNSRVDRQKEQFGLVIEGLRWVSLDIGSASIGVSPRPPVSIASGDSLLLGDALLAANEETILTFQHDGNLVLYGRSGALWNSQTQGKGGVRTVMQSDGNLVIYTNNGTAVWSSQTQGKGPSRLIMQSDKNLVIYKDSGGASWATYTN